MRGALRGLKRSSVSNRTTDTSFSTDSITPCVWGAHRYEGLGYLSELTNALDLTVYLGQLIVNICFWFRDSKSLINVAGPESGAVGTSGASIETMSNDCPSYFDYEGVEHIGFVASLQVRWPPTSVASRGQLDLAQRR